MFRQIYRNIGLLDRADRQKIEDDKKSKLKSYYKNMDLPTALNIKRGLGSVNKIRLFTKRINEAKGHEFI